MKAFVTGSTGLLGNNLVRSLEADGHEVIALARHASKAAAVLDGTAARVVVGDMLRVDGFADQLAGCDVVFHTAAYFREAFEPGSDEEELDRVNIGGTLALLDAADRAGVPCFVHVSSGGTVGRKADGSPGDESTPPLAMQTENPYFRSKIRGDVAIEAWHSGREIGIVEILPGWIWGPWDAAPTGAGKLVTEFRDGNIPANIGGGTCVVDARDVAAAMKAAATRMLARKRDSALPQEERTDVVEKFLVGGHYCTMREVMHHLENATDTKAPPFDVPFPVMLAYAYGCVAWGWLTGGAPLVTPLAVRTMHAAIALDSTKAERELGVRFRDVAETIRDAARWQIERAPTVRASQGELPTNASQAAASRRGA